MKQSIWLKNYEKEVNAKRNESNKNKKIILYIAPAMVAFFTCMALLSGGMENHQAQAGIFGSIGILIFIMTVVIILINKSKRADISKKLVKMFYHFLKLTRTLIYLTSRCLKSQLWK